MILSILLAMITTLQNNLLRVRISSQGAELQEITNLITGQEYLYDGSTDFWKNRRSPVLFPIVGSVWEARYRMDGKEYSLGQHGFARDMEFTPIETGNSDEAWFALESNEESLALFPRSFRLEIGYGLQGERLTVMWRVLNTDTREMHFQIGAHPAFLYPDFNAQDPIHGYLLFDNDKIESDVLGTKGCITDKKITIPTDQEGLIPITATTFDIDTILVEHTTHRVSLLDKEKRPYVSVLYHAPAIGVWSPSPEAPFVCLEPWYGRCDRMDYEGEFKNRDFVNHLAPGDTFKAEYLIVFENL